MFVPIPLLVMLLMLAAIPVVLVAALVRGELVSRGLRLLGRADLYLENHVLEERWCVLYVPVHKRIGCHSYSSL